MGRFDGEMLEYAGTPIGVPDPDPEAATSGYEILVTDPHVFTDKYVVWSSLDEPLRHEWGPNPLRER